jgi:hypothetical protein
MDSDELSNRSKGFSIIDAFMLGEAFGDQVSFVSLNGIIRLVFNFENPSASNWTMTMVMELLTKCCSPLEL